MTSVPAGSACPVQAKLAIDTHMFWIKEKGAKPWPCGMAHLIPASSSPPYPSHEEILETTALLWKQTFKISLPFSSWISVRVQIPEGLCTAPGTRFPETSLRITLFFISRHPLPWTVTHPTQSHLSPKVVGDSAVQQNRVNEQSTSQWPLPHHVFLHCL